MLSALVFITLMPLQVSPAGKSTVPLNRPLAVAAFIDSAQILGLPKFKLRDSNGNLYVKDKALIHESAVVHEHAGVDFTKEVNRRRTYILSYVRGR